MSDSIGSRTAGYGTEFHPGINYARIPVGGDAGGAVAVLGTIAVVMIGVPELRLFYLCAFGSGVLLSVGLFRRFRRHTNPPLGGDPIVLDLTGRERVVVPPDSPEDGLDEEGPTPLVSGFWALR